MNLYEDLKYRGLIENISSPDLIEKLNNGGLTFYVGTDPTADSLHIGHFCSVVALSKRLQDAGHKPIIIAGGATGLIGDPKPTAERKMISKEAMLYNIEKIKEQLSRLLKSDVKLVNNYDWLGSMNAIDYLRDYGKFFNINYMLAKDTVKKRLDIGITYTEFSYMLLQSIDFLKLYEDYNCTLQIGGSDQWGNITSGLELIRKVHGIDTECYALTCPLILKADGTKFGKTESGKSIWLDKDKTSPYEMYQYFINVEDEMVEDYLKKLTFLSKEEIDELVVSLKNEPEKRIASRKLAFEVVKFVHGEDEAIKAQNTSLEVFKNGMSQNMPTIKVKLTDIDNKPIIDLLVLAGILPSKSEARRLIEQGGIKLNGETVKIDTIITKELFNDEVIISKGKKYFVKIELN